MTSVQRNEAGFTLIELLVGLTVLALMATLTLAGYETMASSWRHTEAVKESSDAFIRASNLIEQVLSQIYPGRATLTPDPTIAFDGDDRSIAFLAPLRHSTGAQAIAHYRLYLGTESDLRLLYRFGSESAEAKSDDEANESIVLRGISEIRFRYFGSARPGAAPSWSDSWHRAQSLPELIEVHIATANGTSSQWPDLIVAPRITADMDCVYIPTDGSCRLQ